MASSQPTKSNRLLALMGSERARIAAHLEPIELRLGEELRDRRWVYFPAGSLVSLLSETAAGESAEVGMVGDEGVIGLSLVLGGGRSLIRPVVQGAGPALRIDAGVLHREFEAAGVIQQLLFRYLQALLVQIAQTAVCNRHHTIDQRLCRWLLMSLDRVAADELIMTQEMLSRMLGVRREGVTKAAGKLQDAGAIECKRGRIGLLDRTELEAVACECYQVVRTEFDRLLPPLP